MSKKIAIRYFTRGGNTKKLAEEFACKGSFGVMHKGKPDADDCSAAAAFAKRIAAEGEK